MHTPSLRALRVATPGVAHALVPQASVYGNGGRTFQIGTGIDACRTQSCHLGSSINDGWEAGVKFVPLPWLDVREAHGAQRASGEVARVLGVDGRPDPVGLGGLGNVGRTLRQGHDLQWQVKNVADRRAVYAWCDSGSWGFSPGDGRAVHARIGWRFR